MTSADAASTATAHALYSRVHRYSSLRGDVVLPAAADRVEDYTRRYTGILGWLGVVFNAEETQHLHNVLHGQLDTAQPGSYLHITSAVGVPTLSVDYTVDVTGESTGAGELSMPAVPALWEEYTYRCLALFGGMGIDFSEEQAAHLKTVLREQLAAAFDTSSRSYVVLRYTVDSSTFTVDYTVGPSGHSIASAYEEWLSTRTPPLFGTEPDARIWDLATAVDDPGTFPILDIGAGTGRNALALARRGFPVDAVEMTQSFAGILHDEAAQQKLDNLRVIPTELDSAEEYMHEQYVMIFLSEVVSDFRTVDQLRGVFELASRKLAPGGRLVFNVFLPKDGHTVTDAAREFGQYAYTTIFTREEVDQAASGLDLDLVSDESVYDYEKANLPAEAWPPTSWYENWTSGVDVFECSRESSPIDMRWLVYHRRG